MQENKEKNSYRLALKDKILDAAMHAFFMHGIRAVRMTDIAKELSISKRTMYEIYTTKEELLYEGVKTFREERKKKFLELGKEKDLMEILLKVYRQRVEEANAVNPLFYDDLVKYPRVLRYLTREQKNSREDMMKFFERGVEEGYFRDDVNYELAARLFDALGRYIQEERLYNKYSIKEIFRGMPLVLLRGLCTEKGIEKLQKISR